MEDTAAVVAGLVQTKSIERVLSPITAQVSQLIILNDAYEHGDTDAFPDDLVRNAGIVMRSTEGLVEVAGRLAQDSNSKDLKSRMPSACELLTVAGQNLVTSAHRVNVEKFSADSRRHLVRAAKDVLEGTLKVLLVSDDAEVQKILKSSDWVKDRLGVLTAVRSMKNLVPAFKAFTEVIMLLSNLVEKRRLELINPQYREKLLATMTTLKKCVPMLNSAMQTHVKYPDNAQAKSSKDYVVGEIMLCLEDICSIVQNKYVDTDELDEVEEPGHFITTIDKALDSLSLDRRLQLAPVGTELDIILEAAVRHSMAVAHMSTEKHRNLISKNCQRTLKQRNRVAEMALSVKENPTFSELRQDFNDSCEQLLGEFQDLERHVNASILQLIVTTFYETTEPLERLIKAALTPEAVPGAGSQNALQLYTEAFHWHSDRMCQVARFAASSHPHAKRVRIIRSCVSQLERLDPEIVPACIACQNSSEDRGAVEHLKLLKKEWVNNVTLMLSNIDDIIDTQQLLQVAGQEIQTAVGQCKNSLYSEGQAVADATKAVIGQARRISQLTSRLVDENEDTLYRNGMMVYVTQLNKVTPIVKVSANKVLQDMGELKQHDSFHKRCDTLLKCVLKILQGLEGKGLPDLLHPARRTARSGPVETEDGDLYYLDYEDDAEKENVILESMAETKKLDREQKEKENVALRTYVVDVTNSQLADLSRSLTSAAVAGQQQKVDLVCNDILSRCNLIVEVSKLLAKCVVEPTKKQTLTQMTSDILRVTPELLDKSRKVIQCDTSQVEPLYETAYLWTRQVSFLESYVDGIVAQWKKVSDQVVDAAKTCNIQLLTEEVKHVANHQVYVQDIVSSAASLVDSSELLAAERIRLLQEKADEWENVAATLGTMADILSKTGKTEDKIPLETTSREWASLVYYITSVVSHTACEAVSQLTGHGVCMEKCETTLVRKELATFTDDTIRMKRLVTETFDGCPSGTIEEQAQHLLRELDQLLANMDNCSKKLTHAMTPYMTTEKLYAPQGMCLLQWKWAKKSQEIYKLIDQVTAEFSRMFNGVLLHGTALQTATKDTRDELLVAFFRSLDHFNQQFMKCKADALDALQMSSDIERKSQVRQLLDELSEQAKEMTEDAKKVPDARSDVAVRKLEQFKRNWAPRCYRLVSLLQNMSDANRGAVANVVRHLKTPAQIDSPRILVSSSSPFSAGKLLGEVKDTGVKHDDVTVAKEMGSVVKATSGSPQSVARGQVQKSASSPSGQTREEMPSVSTVNLTGSLLDFGDDLMASYDYLAKGVTTSQSIDRRQHWEELAASIWFTEEEEEVEEEGDRGKNNGPWSFSGTPVGPAVSTPKVAPPREKSWKELAAGPRVQHGTPSRPSEKSGYKASANPRYVSNSGLLKLPLLETVDQWEDSNNSIVCIAKEITRELGHMAEFTRGHGPIQTKEELIGKAKAIAKNGVKLVRFAKILTEYSVDKKCAEDLQLHSDHVPTVIAQLNVMASVKAATPDDATAEKMLIKTAENLVEALNKMLNAAEATCVKGFREPSPDALDDSEALVLATQWKRKFHRHRAIETSNAGVDGLGLKVVNRNTSAPALSQIMVQR